MADSKMGKTGTAPIIKLGQTESNSFGTNSSSKVRGNTTPRDLNLK